SDAGGITRRFDDQQLVEADPGVAIGHGANARVARCRRRRTRIQHHEIVAEAVHLGTAQAHGCSDQPPLAADAGDTTVAAPAGLATEVAGAAVEAAEAGAAGLVGKTSGPFCPQPASDPAASNSSETETMRRRMQAARQESAASIEACSSSRSARAARHGISADAVPLGPRFSGPRWTPAQACRWVSRRHWTAARSNPSGPDRHGAAPVCVAR